MTLSRSLRMTLSFPPLADRHACTRQPSCNDTTCAARSRRLIPGRRSGRILCWTAWRGAAPTAQIMCRISSKYFLHRPKRASIQPGYQQRRIWRRPRLAKTRIYFNILRIAWPFGTYSDSAVGRKYQARQAALPPGMPWLRLHDIRALEDATNWLTRSLRGAGHLGNLVGGSISVQCQIASNVLSGRWVKDQPDELALLQYHIGRLRCKLRPEPRSI